MSYDIFYRRLFVKISEDRVIPFVECGSNNTYCVNDSSGRNMRVRSWIQHYYSKVQGWMDMATLKNCLEEELSKKIEENRSVPATEIEQQFGSHACVKIRSTWPTWNAYKSFFLNGFTQAVTLEELCKHDIYLSLRVYNRSVELQNHPGIPTTFRSTSDLVKALATWSLLLPDHTRQFALSGYLDDYFEEKRWQARSNRYENERRKTTLASHRYYVLVDGSGNYFSKQVKTGYKYSDYQRRGKKFLLASHAEAFSKRLRTRFTVRECHDAAPIEFSISPKDHSRLAPIIQQANQAYQNQHADFLQRVCKPQQQTV